MIHIVRSVLRHLRPDSVPRLLLRQRELLLQLSRRQIHQQFRGTMLGRLWLYLQPLLLLVVYTFVFSTVLKARFGDSPDEPKTRFALTLFAGMIVFNIFADCINLAPTKILENINYVKKVVFPLEILPVVNLATSLSRLGSSLIILIAGLLLLEHRVPWTALYFPLVVAPAIMLSLGFSWLLSSCGVFVRDLGQAVLVVTQLLYFLTPVFYPISRVPESLKWLIMINPLAELVEDARRVLIWNQAPDWSALAAIAVLSYLVMSLGYAWFMETKRGFADVL